MDMDPAQLRLYMSQQNAHKEFIRKKKREIRARSKGTYGMSDDDVVDEMMN